MSDPWGAVLAAIAASLVWAPLLFFLCSKLSQKSERALYVWCGASVLLIAPVIVAGLIAAFGAAPQILELSVGAEAVSQFTAPVIKPDAGMQLFAIAAWFYGAGLCIALLAAGFRQIYFSYRLRYASHEDAAFLAPALIHWRKRLGVRRSVRIVLTDLIGDFCVFGFVRPVILAPREAADQPNAANIDLMIAHELAHVKRSDTVLFAGCALLRAVYWFNPFAQRLIDEVVHQAEVETDAVVLSAGGDRLLYARCFLASLRSPHATATPPALVPAFAYKKLARQKSRLAAMLNFGRTPQSRPNRSPYLTAGALTVAAILLGALVAPASPPRFTPSPSAQPGGAGSTANFDLADESGPAIFSPATGVVVAVERKSGGKSSLTIEFDSGARGQYVGLASVFVRAGDAINSGDIIGVADVSGSGASRIYLDTRGAEALFSQGEFAQLSQHRDGEKARPIADFDDVETPAISPAAFSFH